MVNPNGRLGLGLLVRGRLDLPGPKGRNPAAAVVVSKSHSEMHLADPGNTWSAETPSGTVALPPLADEPDGLGAGSETDLPGGKRNRDASVAAGTWSVCSFVGAGTGLTAAADDFVVVAAAAAAAFCAVAPVVDDDMVVVAVFVAA